MEPRCASKDSTRGTGRRALVCKRRSGHQDPLAPLMQGSLALPTTGYPGQRERLFGLRAPPLSLVYPLLAQPAWTVGISSCRDMNGSPACTAA